MSYLMVLTIMQPIYSWSGIGHDTIGRIAFNLLNTDAVDFVRTRLELSPSADLESAIVTAGRWADQVPDDMEWSRDLHFANTPTRECVGFDLDRDCSRCIVSAIANYTMRSLNYDLSDSERGDALRFVIHFMGDIHIPMHIGFKGDAGGNSISITGYSAKYPVTLHNVWDYHLLQLFNRKALSDSVTSMDSADTVFDADITYNSMLDAATAMAFETNRLACTSSYRHTTCNNGACWIESGDSLEQEYWDANFQVASSQLKLAGTRLANLLNLMAVASPDNFDSPKSAYILQALGVITLLVFV